MTKVLKKSFACVLAIVLCLTCMLGALTVSAVTGSFAVKDASVTVGAETVDVEVTVTAPGVNELLMKVETEAGIATAVSSNPVDAALMIEGSDTIAITKGRSLDGFADAVVVTVTITLEEGLAAGDYTVTAKLLSASDGQENLFEIDNEDATISVVEEVAEGLVATTEPGGSTTNYALRGRVRGLTYAEDDQNPVVAVGLLGMVAEGAPAEITRETDGAYDYRITMTQLEDAGYTLENATYYINIAGLNVAKTMTDFAFVPYVELRDGTVVYATKVEYCFADYLVANYGTNAKAKAILDAYYTMTSNTAFDGIATKYTALDNAKTYTKTYAENTYDLSVDSNLTAVTSCGGSTSGFALNLKAGSFAYAGEGTVTAVGLAVLDSNKYTSGSVTLDTDGVFNYEFALNDQYSSLEAINNAGGIFVKVSGLKLNNIVNDYIIVPYVKLADDSIVYADGSAYCFADYLIDTGIKSATSTTASRSNGFLDAYAKVTGTVLYSVSE